MVKKVGTNKDDTIYGTNHGDVISGKGGNDHLIGGVGNDKVYGDAGNDELYASGGKDLLDGGAGFDLVNLYFSKRGVHYTVGQSEISFQDFDGNRGTSTLKSMEAVAGSTFNDVLMGSKGENYINGNLGNDQIDGRAGDDVLFNGGGKDTITGGSGDDFFGFNGDKITVTKITDFNVADDSFMFKNALFEELQGVGRSHTVHYNTYRSIDAAQIQIGDAHDALDADIRIIYDQTDGYLYYDLDGSGADKATAVAFIGKDLALTENDFFVY
ncbi:hypothetical protein JJB09_26300 [Rhizobium sp. KVB221]|uniref:Calcium-binding protein n=1 Tax=Rhizobium setariae TaxID=2801340 RepID=A0A936YRP4_9HYPH|nr:calcium-binding protein [Rhizobium setariae]MBL0375523.1 hypothetical protein [Rhizobium setariae]